MDGNVTRARQAVPEGLPTLTRQVRSLLQEPGTVPGMGGGASERAWLRRDFQRHRPGGA